MNNFPYKPGGGNCQNFPCPDAFIAKVQSNGTALEHSTYLGGEGIDVAWGLAVTPAGDAVVTGETRAPNFPLVKPLQAEPAGGMDAFVTWLSGKRSW